MWLIRCLFGNFRSLTLRLRYKEPEAGASKELEFSVADGGQSLEDASGDFHFAEAVAAFGLLLGNSEHKGQTGDEMLLELDPSGREDDASGHREEFIRLAKTAAALAK